MPFAEPYASLGHAPARPLGIQLWRVRALLPDRWKAPKMPFTGANVVALGVPPGPPVGAVLKAFEDWWIAQDFTADAARQIAQAEGACCICTWLTMY